MSVYIVQKKKKNPNASESADYINVRGFMDRTKAHEYMKSLDKSTNGEYIWRVSSVIIEDYYVEGKNYHGLY